MHKRRKDRYGLGGEVHFQMAPLIDVVFLLLIFFITVTTFHEADKMDMILAYAKMAEEFKDKGSLVVNVTRTGSIVVLGQDAVQREFTDVGSLEGYMDDVKAQQGDVPVAIRADKYARMKEIKDVYRAAARAGLTRISLVTQTRKEEQKMITGRPEIVVGEDEVPEEDLIY
jgi:biopolymer transport protein ExbD